jgi:2,5-diketo-D-gluconate reductase A
MPFPSAQRSSAFHAASWIQTKLPAIASTTATSATRPTRTDVGRITSMKRVPHIQLNDGNLMPQLGLGVWQIPDEQTVQVVRTALEMGYRAIDTASIYGNERGVGNAIAASAVPRDELFITTKLWNDRHAYDDTLRACDESLSKLQMEYVDLYLIHWPVPSAGKLVEAWKALIQLQKDGKVKSIGVSNFQPAHLQRIVNETGVTPAVNQVELHPLFQQRPLRNVHASMGVTTESWSPLGQGKLLDNPVLKELARKHDKTTAQIILRWHTDNDLVVIPKSVTPNRIRENIDILDFRLDAADMDAIAALDTNGRIGPDPDTFG